MSEKARSYTVGGPAKKTRKRSAGGDRAGRFVAVSPYGARSAILIDIAARAQASRADIGVLARLAELKYSEEEIGALVVPKRTLARRRAANEQLTVEETDKALRLVRVAVHANRVFGDPEKAHRWLRKPKGALDGETPLAYLASEAGARIVEDMLLRIEHGIFA